MEKEVVLTPVMQQYVNLKKEHEHEVLFFRIGDFYEMFFEDAVEVSRLLNLTLTHRGEFPMCGIPYHAAKIYIARLLRLGKKISICEQVGDPKLKGLTERKVVEIITPGTACESEYLEGNSNNFLAALSISKGMAGFAYIDVTTSGFFATNWHASKMGENFLKELGRAGPRELLLPQSLKNNEDIQVAIQSQPNMSVSFYPDWDFGCESGYKKLVHQFKTASLQSFGLTEQSAEVGPAGFLLDYLEKTTNSAVPHVNSIKVYSDSQYLIIDDSSRRNLEIVTNLRDGTSKFTLLECVNFAKTAMGNRMLRNWLLFPETDISKIQKRHDHVEFFVKNQTLLDQVQEKLSGILDIERLAGRIAMDKAHPKDLQALKNSLASFLEVQTFMNDFDFPKISDEKALWTIDLIDKAIDENPSVAITDGRIIKSGWSSQLDHWRDVHDNFDKILMEYELQERNETGIPTLKIKYNNNAGYFIEVSKGKLASVPPHFIMRRALVNGDRYTTQRLQELELELNQAGTKILELERDLFIEIRTKLHEVVPYFLELSNLIAYFDSIASFSKAAILHGWVRPSMSLNGQFLIENGRHPVVEFHLPRGEFVPNSIELNYSQNGKPSFAIITGPNMAGKSTYLRQNALIALLAQTGSFVPAKKADIGIVDRIFCRVGASDNLAKGESTFLVEMTETANILRSATEKSLVIMDEVGRGTSTEDGLAIAWAVSEYLIQKIKCRTLFATHYHELTRLQHPSLKLLCMSVHESNGNVTFLRKVVEGASENSYGIHVASLAGVPNEVVQRANVILSHIQNVAEKKSMIEDDSSCFDYVDFEKKDEVQLEKSKIEENIDSVMKTPGLFSDEEIVLDEILSANPDELTPMQSLQMISRWKKTLSGI